MSDTDTKKPILSAIIVNWNAGHALLDCLESIYNTIDVPFEIIVVDNNSSDKSAQMAKNNYPDIKLLEQKENLGYSKSNNLGAQYARGEYILILNPDTILLDNAINELLNFSKTHENAGMVGPKILDKDKNICLNYGNKLPTIYRDFLVIFLLQKAVDWFKVKLFKYALFRKKIIEYYEKTKEVEFIPGSCMLIKKNLYELLGGFDEIVPMYLDDIDICFRARKKSFRNFFVSSSAIIHIGQYSTRKSYHYKMYDVLCAQAHLFYYRKNFGSISAFMFRLILMISIPYLIFLDIMTLPYFIVKKMFKERLRVFKKHVEYFKLAMFEEVKWHN